MSHSRGLIGRLIPIGLSTFLWTSLPATAQVAGEAERTPEAVTGVRAEINAEGTGITVSWELSDSDRISSVPVGTGDFTSGGSFAGINGVDDYLIYRQGADDDEPTQVGSVNAGINTFVDRSFTVGTTYTYSVTATPPAGDNESDPAVADTQIDVGPPPAVTLTVDQASLGEGDGLSTVTVTATLARAWSLSTPVEVSISDAGTAEQANGRDYTAAWAAGQTITVAAGETEASTTLSLSLNDDNLAEGDVAETIVVEGTSAVTAGATTTPVPLEVTGTEITVTDNDVAPTSVMLTVDTASLDEGAGDAEVQVTATLGDGSTAILVDTEVSVSLGGTHVDLGPDYEASNFTITIPAEQTAGSEALAISVNDDNLAEGDESIELSGEADGFTVESTSIGLTDNDVAPTSVTLTVDTATLAEDAGDVEVQVTATLGDGSTAILNETTVMVSLGGTHVDLGPDYAAEGIPITIPAGAVDGTGPLAISVNDDNLAEGDETIEVAGAADGFTVESASIGLTDNDVAPTSITLTVDTASLGEDAGDAEVQVTATLGDGSTAILDETVVTLSLSGTHVDLGPDYTVGEVTVTVPAGAVDGTGPLAISVNDDNLAEGDETIDIAGAADGFTVAATSIGLTDNDVAPTSITLTVDTASLGEDAGDAEVQVTATLGDGSTAILDETVVTLSLSGTHVDLGPDYTVGEVTVTVPAGAVDGTGPLAISVNDDNLAEGDETIDIAGAADGFTVAATSIGLTDNDVAPASITLTVDTASLGEDAGDTEVQVTATLGDGSTAILDETTVAVSFGGTDEALGSDYEASDFTITVAAGAVDGSSTLTLTPNDDNLAEGDETIEVSGSADGFTVVSAEIGLTDNDVAPDSITLTVADPASLAEGAGETAVTVTATLGDGSTALLTETQVTLSLSGTDEALGPDYTAGEVIITVAPGATAGSGPVPPLCFRGG